MVAPLGRAFPPQGRRRFFPRPRAPAGALQPSRDAHAQPLAEPPTRASRPPAPTACHPRTIPGSKAGLRRSWRRLGLDAVAGEEPVETDTWTTRSVAPLEDAACWLECLLHKDGNSRGSEPLSFPFFSFPFLPFHYQCAQQPAQHRAEQHAEQAAWRGAMMQARLQKLNNSALLAEFPQPTNRIFRAFLLLAKLRQVEFE